MEAMIERGTEYFIRKVGNAPLETEIIYHNRISYNKISAIIFFFIFLVLFGIIAYAIVSMFDKTQKYKRTVHFITCILLCCVVLGCGVKATDTICGNSDFYEYRYKIYPGQDETVKNECPGWTVEEVVTPHWMSDGSMYHIIEYYAVTDTFEVIDAEG